MEWGKVSELRIYNSMTELTQLNGIWGDYVYPKQVSYREFNNILGYKSKKTNNCIRNSSLRDYRQILK